MNNMESILSNCVLFKGLPKEEIRDFIDSRLYRVKKYNKDEIIGLEGEDCKSIGIVLDGKVEVQKIYHSGNVTTLARLSSHDIFGEVIIFSNRSTYPATITCISDSKIAFISKEEVLRLCNENVHFLEKFMKLLSNKILMLNKKVTNLSFKTIRQKVSNYLLEEYKKQGKMKIKVEMNRKDMAQYMGVQRPSLSRELINMKEDGIIDFDRNIIVIKDLDALEDSLLL